MRLPRLDGLNVLFVDDRRDARFVVEHILKDAGATVTVLENGRQAVELMAHSSRALDVAIFDISMPIMDGLTATRRLRQEGIETPIIALTAGVMEEDREECFAAGCNAYLRKPVNGARLVEMVANLAGVCSS